MKKHYNDINQLATTKQNVTVNCKLKRGKRRAAKQKHEDKYGWVDLCESKEKKLIY